MNVLVVDVGGTNVKMLATGQHEPRRFPSGPTMTAAQMAAKVKESVGAWKYDVVSIGYPGFVVRGRPVTEPHNLAPGWVGFDFQAALGRPVKVINDAAMQALGSYQGGKLLFLGLGTGLGAAMIVEGVIEPMELAHLPYKKGTFEDYVGQRGLDRTGKKKWGEHVADVVARLVAALEPDDVVLGGGNVKKLGMFPPGCRAGDNANAFLGGFRLWDEPAKHGTLRASEGMRVGICTDHGGFQLKEELVGQLRVAGYEVVDFGAKGSNPGDDYPDFVIPLAEAVSAGTVERGVAVCGSGVGASVCANKIPDVRAALISDHFSAKQGVEDDHMNILCLGGRTVGHAVAWDLVQTFLEAKFIDAERHLRRLGKVAALDAKRAEH